MATYPTTTKKTGITQAFLVLLFVFIAVYLLSTSVFLYFAQYAPLTKVLAVLFFLSEFFVMVHAFGYFWGIYNLNRRPAEVPYGELKEFPPVAILVPARHEPKEVLTSTLEACRNLEYPNKSIYLLDDSSEEKYRKEAEEVSARFGASIFRRTIRHGAKAGIVNDCVKGLKDKYVAIFDADQNPIPDFLNRLVWLLETDDRLAFVQTPQFYSNLDSSRISFASNIQQAIFYEYICEGKNMNKSMICCGTNVVMRRQALMDVGGLDESTVTEDFATSFKMHLKGWKSLYYNHVHTFGMGPEDLGSYFKQQNRWALGNVGVLLRIVLARFVRNPLLLKPAQWLEYFITGSYYFIGWAYLLLVAYPITYLFFNVPPFCMDQVVYILTFVPYFLLSIGIYYKSMLGRHYTMRQLWRGQALSFITLPVYMKASLMGLLGVKSQFQVTAKGGAKTISYFKLWPQVAVWVICLAALVWGANRLIYEQSSAVAVNMLWTAYHFLLLCQIFYFNEEEPLSSACKKLKMGVRFEHRRLEEEASAIRKDGSISKLCITVALKSRLDPGSLLMCKVVRRGQEAIIFDASVIAVSGRSLFGG